MCTGLDLFILRILRERQGQSDDSPGPAVSIRLGTPIHRNMIQHLHYGVWLCMWAHMRV